MFLNRQERQESLSIDRDAEKTAIFPMGKDFFLVENRA
jgi:hypothetical protein